VVAVTAIDRNDQIYPYANQGGYISFAALGVDVETASPPNGKSIASGTSFAAPVVAALIARMNQAKTADGAQQALSHLVKAARHLGPPGRNPVFGYGAVGPAVLITD
ncbi:MAG: S8 family serine peptidase, partial [Pseudomonadota bacterium]|nr:S8 family serine peptidase [Pseudomonadota bacterium]